MNPAIAPPTALGAASAMATAAAPADSSKPGRAINTQPAIRTLGAIPQRRPVTTAPPFLNALEKKAIAAVTKMPQTITYAKNTRSLLLQMWLGLIARIRTASVAVTVTSHAHKNQAAWIAPYRP